MKKRKTHNKIKRLITQSKIAVRGIALVMSFADKLVDCVNQKTGKPILIGPAVAEALNRTQFQWFVILAVYCLESNGKRKMVTLNLPLKAEYRHDELTEFLSSTHQQMQDECASKMTVINSGWAAVPVPKDSEEVMEADLVKLLDDEKHWSYKHAA